MEWNIENINDYNQILTLLNNLFEIYLSIGWLSGKQTKLCTLALLLIKYPLSWIL